MSIKYEFKILKITMNLKRCLFSGCMANYMYFSGGSTYIHALPEFYLKKLCYYQMTKLKLSKKYVTSSLLLIDKLNPDDNIKWSFSSAYHNYPNWKTNKNLNIPGFYITKEISEDKFTKCDNELILKGLSVHSISNIQDFVSTEDPDIGTIFKFTGEIDMNILPPFVSNEDYNLFLQSLDSPVRE